jgi:AcrR family transcriptional regulator
MARKYDGSRRTEAAAKTRDAIVQAAFRLHGRGITDYEPLAEEAGVSLATVRKNFPTRELLFQNCTAWGMHHVMPMPDLVALAATAGPEDRVRLAAEQTSAIYDSLFGQLRLAYRLHDESPALAASMLELAELQDNVANLVVEAWPEIDSREARGLVLGFLSYFTYYGLRHDGGLPHDQTVLHISEAILHSLRAMSHGGEKEVAAS